MTTLLFLHVPKTAGQTVHFELTRITGENAVSPIRVHTQADATPEAQMPVGYKLYSGHIDWGSFEHLPPDRFAFTVLRDPRERIASFYFFLLRQAEKRPEHALEDPKAPGMWRVRKWSADDYFLAGDRMWQTFIRDHYDNFYCSYFATRKVRGRAELQGMDVENRISQALVGLEQLDRVYDITNLDALERDIHQVTGHRIHVVGRYANASGHHSSDLRWPKLMDRLEKDSARARLEDFVAQDLELLDQYYSKHPEQATPTALPQVRQRWYQALLKRSRW